MTTSVYCEATFRYYDVPESRVVSAPVLDARSAGDTIDFERTGFTRVDHRSRVTDWSDGRELDRVYRREMERFAAEFTGCDVAVSFPLIARSLEAARAEADYGPIEFVHNDFTDDYRSMVTESDRPYQAFLAPMLAEHGLTRADLVEASRLMVLQWWRNIGPVEADFPLAMCDAETIDASRLVREVVPFYGGRRLDFEIFAVTPPADGGSDRWYTYPQLTVDEAIVLRTYDSAGADAGRAFWTPHSAFRDPRVPDAAEHRRSSIEARALCVWR